MQYPPLKATDLVPLMRIQAALKANPAYLDDKSCPYSKEVRDFLRVFAPVAAPDPVFTAVQLDEAAESVLLGGDGTKFEVIQAQIDAIYTELHNLKVEDPQERIQIAKAKTTLLDKMVSLHERADNLRKISEFKRQVTAAVDRLPVAEREKFFKALEEA